MFDIPTRPTCLHHFVEENAEALQNAALLLGGRPWLKRVQCLFEMLYTGNSLHGRAGRDVSALHDLLTLAHVHDPSRPEAAYFASLDPASPQVEEICLLADELRRAFEEVSPGQPSHGDQEERRT
ncbi:MULTISPECIES: hypothetical protein [unclassified Sulfitobacter]|jgi:hypothetical protein|uniref:hypothetical protein n=1 Tax=unclassified Sulfitobacter TaxID=196795 RepID=UPI0007C348F2|nr:MULTISPECIES: hypothetical protein [unclassified Sulfitobacter]KZX97872.1 hypothetical protein A3721_06985 [Sulfitobacter sp. HI0023]KZY25329.1 hypothetical protein A3728_19290 [Sulfitobacter sp. HI0040]KZZ63468.1 hypothetical protein A3764_21675 [Sulfitobacter sp. HI0129]